MYIKKVKFKNSLGEIFFDNHSLFCESIDTTGNSVRTVSEQLLNSHGNITVSSYLNAKTIPCSFKFVDLDGNASLRDFITQIFNPLIIGELTVFGEHHNYTIDCRPSEIPTISRTEIPWIYSWNVDFIADYPLWRKGHQKFISLNSYSTSLLCKTAVDTPATIYLPPNHSGQFRINGNGFSIAAHEVGVYVNTKNYTVTGTDSNDYTNLLSIDNISKCVLSNGLNTIECESWIDVILYYYELSLGVV